MAPRLATAAQRPRMGRRAPRRVEISNGERIGFHANPALHRRQAPLRAIVEQLAQSLL